MFAKRSTSNTNDATLVMYSLGGNRDAFCEIVSRYQNLLCSLAYSAVGDIKHSEDIAQEAFVDAWKTLDSLRDPEKLKSWLCGILRFKVSHFRRKEAHQPLKQAQELEEHPIADVQQAGMDKQIIQQQEQALLWKALDGMEQNYREPLILFYRQQQSVERVAIELELSEDTVKQRLSRGRKLLKQAMTTFVEDALEKSKPGATFTASVLAIILVIPPPAKAAAWGAGAAKTGSLFNLATLLAVLASCAGLISSYFGLRASLDQSRTKRERALAIKSVSLFMLVSLAYVVGIFGLKYLAIGSEGNTGFYTLLSQVLVLATIGIYVYIVARMFAATRRLRAQERLFQPDAFLAEVDQVGSTRREYKSSLRLFGVPLFHFQFGTPEITDKPAYGWVSGGSSAYGLLFAWGGVAVAPISVGIISVGIVSVGAIGFGILSTGMIAVGVITFGASTIGYKAYASMSAMGWESAFSNGFSIAKHGAIGPIAYAEKINSEQAAAIVHLTQLGQSYQWVLAAISILVIVPAVLYSRKVRQRMRPTSR